MFTLSNMKYLFLISIMAWTFAPVLDVLGVPSKHKVNDIIGVIQGISWYSLMIFTLTINTFARDGRRNLYLKMFGTGRYNMSWTFILLPCVLYAFMYDYITYTWVCGSMFLMLEFIRTVQNTYANEYYDLKVKREIAELNK